MTNKGKYNWKKGNRKWDGKSRKRLIKMKEIEKGGRKCRKEENGA